MHAGHGDVGTRLAVVAPHNHKHVMHKHHGGLYVRPIRVTSLKRKTRTSSV